jgi:hypothetical protein
MADDLNGADAGGEAGAGGDAGTLLGSDPGALDAGKEQAAGEQAKDPTTLLGAEGTEDDDAGKQDGDGADKDKKTDDPAAEVPENADGYELKFADGVKLDEELLTSFKSTAHELGLTQGQSQKLASLYESHVAKANEAAQKAQVEALNKAQGEWEAELKGSETYKADVGYARKALREYGSPELRAVMNQTRIGSFPAFFKFVSAVGKALSEPGIKGTGDNKTPELPIAQRLWKNM